MRADSREPAAPVSTAPSVIPVDAAPWTTADQRRLDGGRELCFVLGLYCVVLIGLPLPDPVSGGVVFRVPGQVAGSEYAWFSADGLRIENAVVLIPAVGGLLALVAAFRRPWTRGILSLLAGTVLLLSGPTYSDYSPVYSTRYAGVPGFRQHVAFFAGPFTIGGSGISMLLLMILLAVSAGGHLAAGERRPAVNRMAAILPALAMLPCTLLVGAVVLSAVLLEGGLGNRFGDLGPAQEALVTAATVTAAALIASANLLGLINGGLGSRGVAKAGFGLSLAGLLTVGVGLGGLFVVRGGDIIANAPWTAASLAVHNFLPFTAGLVLLAAGYRRMWLWLASRTAPRGQIALGDAAGPS